MTRPPLVIRHVPNLLSGMRLLLAAAFPLLPDDWRLPAVLVGGISDLLDGFIARRFGVTSVRGALLDAIADKALVLGVLLTLAADGVINWWQVPLTLARDLAVLAIAVFAATISDWASFRRMAPRAAGKLTTLLVFAWFLVLLVPGLAPGVTVAFGLAATASVLAAGDYLFQFTREMRRRADRAR